MTELTDKITLTLTSDRKLISIETTNLRVRLNGLTNADYKQMLGAAGIELRFEESQEEKREREKLPVAAEPKGEIAVTYAAGVISIADKS
jgi:hypothetical protein